MHPLVKQLTGVLAPPPGGGDLVDWENIYHEYGLILPADYRSFVETYGGGSIDDCIAISTPPVDGSIYGDLLVGAPFVSGRLHPEGYPYYPDPDGLLEWCASSFGDSVFWRCSSKDPDKWTIFAFRRQVSYDEEHWKAFDGGMVEFLLAIIRGVHPGPFSDPTTPSAESTYLSWRDEYSVEPL